MLEPAASAWIAQPQTRAERRGDHCGALASYEFNKLQLVYLGSHAVVSEDVVAGGLLQQRLQAAQRAGQAAVLEHHCHRYTHTAMASQL